MNTFLADENWESNPANQVGNLAKKPSASRIYLDFYNLHEPPFSITPDPEFLYLSSVHKSVIEKILYGIEARMGFLLLIGEVGTGKSTLCRAILDKLDKKAETVYIINPSLSGTDLLLTILDDLGIDYPTNISKKYLLDHLNRFLLTVPEDKAVVIIIDDAQTMTMDGLENLRLLSNLETDKKKLLQLVLVGQQELLHLLSCPEMRQLKQRVSICCQLERITDMEMQGYISHRLFVAGDKGQINFSSGAIRKIYKASRGIPRLINIICDYTLTAGYISNSYTIKSAHAERAINEIRNASSIVESRRPGVLSGSLNKRVWIELSILVLTILLAAFINIKEFINTDVISSNKETGVSLHPISGPLGSERLSASENVNDLSTINKESPVILTTNFNPTEGLTPDITELPYPYIIQLASLKSLTGAMKETNDLREKGIDAHWNSVYMLDGGLWYRVYTGRFSTKEEAQAFKQEKDLSSGIIMSTPWTILVAHLNGSEKDGNRCSELLDNGYDCILTGDIDTGYKITTGAFKSSEGASRTAQDMMKLGFDVKTVLR
jgi:general secretion pathway protein A